MAGDLYFKVDFGASPALDDGTRPWTGANPFWNNFSLFLEGGPNQTQTRVGTPTRVRARVTNKGRDAAENVRADIYVMNPHVGASSPSMAVRQLRGQVNTLAPGSGGTSPNDAHVLTCRINDPVLGPVDWEPTQAELNATVNGGGHLCLIANVFSDTEGQELALDSVFDVVNDQHQGQRNCTLLPRQNFWEGFQEFQVMAAPELIETTVAVEPVEAKVALGAGERWLLLSDDSITFSREHKAPVVLVKGKPYPLFLDDELPEVRMEAEEIGALDPASRCPGSSARCGPGSGSSPATSASSGPCRCSRSCSAT